MNNTQNYYSFPWKKFGNTFFLSLSSILRNCKYNRVWCWVHLNCSNLFIKMTSDFNLARTWCKNIFFKEVHGNSWKLVLYLQRIRHWPTHFTLAIFGEFISQNSGLNFNSSGCIFIPMLKISTSKISQNSLPFTFKFNIFKNGAKLQFQEL